MSREIKFRALTPSKKLIYLSLVPMQELDEMQMFWALADINTIALFTGLHDKNGKEIYGGDLIECYSTSGEKVYTYPHEVKLPNFYREIWSYNEHGLPANIGQKTKVLVVGNIYENPELLNHE